MKTVCGCPGSRVQDRPFDVAQGRPFDGAQGRRDTPESTAGSSTGDTSSQLRQWPLQLHLVGPQAPYYQGADVLLAADCVAFAVGNFHEQFLKGKSLAIACPKLDDGQEIYAEKIKALCEDAKINTLTVMIMEVPCCMGLVNLARQVMDMSARKVPMKLIMIGLDGVVRQETWLN